MWSSTRWDEQDDQLSSAPADSETSDDDEGQKLPVVLVVHCSAPPRHSFSRLCRKQLTGGFSQAIPIWDFNADVGTDLNWGRRWKKGSCH